MKPLEFKIERDTEEELDILYKITFYYEDGTIDYIYAHSCPKGLELGKHYSISDIYGYKVVDDRKGL